MLPGTRDAAFRDYQEEQRNPTQFDWAGGNAVAFLDTLRTHPRRVLIVPDRHRGFVRESDLDALFARLDSTEPCAVVLMPISAHLPQERSTVGHEAALLIEAFRQGEYPDMPASDLDTIDVAELRRWRETWRSAQPVKVRDAQHSELEDGKAYVDDFTIDGGWQPVTPLPLPHHHYGRLELVNLDAFGKLRFGVWKRARVTFRVLRRTTLPTPGREWRTWYEAEILRVE